MPPKKKTPFMFSIDPELYQRSHTPAMTIAMGMKSSQASSLCWVDQVRREEALHDRWATTYDPSGSLQVASTTALHRTLARDEARREAYLSPQQNPQISLLLPKNRIPQGSVKPADAETTTPTMGVAAEAMPLGATSGSSTSVTQAYLKARCDAHPLKERFPRGPATAAQHVGWAATAASLSSSTPKSSRRAMGAYRKPEDDDHAALLGFDYAVK